MFVPSTPGSRLRNSLKEKDDVIREMTGDPALKFIEKGDTVIDRVGQSDLWKGDPFCLRKDCFHCRGRYKIAEEQEERAAAKITGEKPKSNPPKGTSGSIPGYTTEGVTYSLECLTCW